MLNFKTGKGVEGRESGGLLECMLVAEVTLLPVFVLGDHVGGFDVDGSAGAATGEDAVEHGECRLVGIEIGGIQQDWSFSLQQRKKGTDVLGARAGNARNARQTWENDDSFKTI